MSFKSFRAPQGNLQDCKPARGMFPFSMKVQISSPICKHLDMILDLALCSPLVVQSLEIVLNVESYPRHHYLPFEESDSYLVQE